MMTADLDTRPRSSGTPSRKSLVQKFDIPVNHLDFDYVEKCDNGKELEKILKILRSNEEGYYPDLLKCAEDRLRLILPSSRLLRHETRPLDKKSLSKEEWAATVNEIGEWSEKMKTRENPPNNINKTPLIFPDVRQSGDIKSNKPHQNGKKLDNRIKSCDYKVWDKYDADLECLKMDLDDMKKEEEESKTKESGKDRLEEKKSVEASAVDSLDQAQIDLLSEDERQEMANNEKMKGNEYYNDKWFEKAVWYYTRSIHIYPNPVVYNNRAACYLVLCKFSLALQDLNKVIEEDPDNVKARYRRAQALQHLNKFEEALEDTRLVLSKKPDYAVAKIMAEKLVESCASLPKKHRLVLQDRDTGKSSYVVVTDDELATRSDIRGKVQVRVNEFGLPVAPCRCHLRHRELNVSQRGNYRSTYQADGSKASIPLKEASPTPDKTVGPKKIDIIELERIVEEEKIDDSRSIVKTVVTDKRTVKSPAVSQEKTVKIHTNEIIKRERTPETVNESAKEVKTSKNTFLQETLRTDGRIERILSPRDCGCRADYPPFHFKSAWNQERELSFKAQLLKSICPQHLSKAFGNSWESDMLIDIFRCLQHHFDPETEKNLIASYMEAVVNFSRFKINFSFLNDEGKKLAQKLLEITGQPQLLTAIRMS